MYCFLHLRRDSPSWKITFLVQNGWSHKRGSIVLISMHSNSSKISDILCFVYPSRRGSWLCRRAGCSLVSFGQTFRGSSQRDTVRYPETDAYQNASLGWLSDKDKDNYPNEPWLMVGHLRSHWPFGGGGVGMFMRLFEKSYKV